jgi:hypothetical protein
MSYPTQPTYILSCNGWDNTEHPVMAWMHEHQKSFDSKDMIKNGPGNWMTEDFVYVKPTGEVVSGVGPAFEAIKEMYAPLKDHYHEPKFGLIWDTSDGYELFGVANMYANFPVPGGGEKCKDLKGDVWDICTPGAFHFKYCKDSSGPQGLKLKVQKLYADTLPMVGKMIERGMVKPEQLTGGAK